MCDHEGQGMEIEALKEQITELKARIEELEAENAKRTRNPPVPGVQMRFFWNS